MHGGQQPVSGSTIQLTPWILARTVPLDHPISVALISPAPFNFPQGTTCPASTTQPCTISVAVSPTVAGTAIGQILITDTTSQQTTTVNVTGTAGTAVASFSPTSLTFPLRSVNTTSIPMSVTLTNTGAGVYLNTSSVTISGVVNGNFAITSINCTNTSLAPNGTCSIGVTFAPMSTGGQPATVTVTSSASNSPTSFTVAGTAQ